MASELNAVWEARRVERPLVLIPAGSSLRLLERLNRGQPLYGRFARQCHLKPLCILARRATRGISGVAGPCLGIRRVRWHTSLPAAIDQRRPLAENIQSLMLDASGEVRDLVRTALLQEQGLRDIPKYRRRYCGPSARMHHPQRDRPICRIGGRHAPARQTRAPRTSRICRLVAQFRDYLTRSGTVSTHRPGCPVLLPICRPVGKCAGDSGGRAVWKQHVQPNLDTHMGHVFERVAEEARYRMQSALELPRCVRGGDGKGKTIAAFPGNRHRRSADKRSCAHRRGQVESGAYWRGGPYPPSRFAATIE